MGTSVFSFNNWKSTSSFRILNEHVF